MGVLFIDIIYLFIYLPTHLSTYLPIVGDVTKHSSSLETEEWFQVPVWLADCDKFSSRLWAAWSTVFSLPHSFMKKPPTWCY